MIHPERWDEVKEKRDALWDFLETPKQPELVRVFESLWAMTARTNVRSFVESTVLGETPEQTLEQIQEYLDSHRKNVNSGYSAVDDLLEVSGFGPATTTELLHTITPENVPIWNETARDFMSRIDENYDPVTAFCFDGSVCSEFLFRILDRTEEIEAIYTGFLRNDEVEPYPDDFTRGKPSEAEQFDFLAYAAANTDYPVAWAVIENNPSVIQSVNTFKTGRSADGSDLSHLDGWDLPAGLSRETVDTMAVGINSELMDRVQSVVETDPTYRSTDEFVRSAIRNELQQQPTNER